MVINAKIHLLLEIAKRWHFPLNITTLFIYWNTSKVKIFISSTIWLSEGFSNQVLLIILYWIILCFARLFSCIVGYSVSILAPSFEMAVASLLQSWELKICPDIAKWPLGTKSFSIENHCYPKVHSWKARYILDFFPFFLKPVFKMMS